MEKIIGVLVANLRGVEYSAITVCPARKELHGKSTSLFQFHSGYRPDVLGTRQAVVRSTVKPARAAPFGIPQPCSLPPPLNYAGMH